MWYGLLGVGVGTVVLVLVHYLVGVFDDLDFLRKSLGEAVDRTVRLDRQYCDRMNRMDGEIRQNNHQLLEYLQVEEQRTPCSTKLVKKAAPARRVCK